MVLRLLLCSHIVDIFMIPKEFYENFRLTFSLHLAILLVVKAMHLHGKINNRIKNARGAKNVAFAEHFNAER